MPRYTRMNRDQPVRDVVDAALRICTIELATLRRQPLCLYTRNKLFKVNGQA